MKRILFSHGAGGESMHELIRNVMLKNISPAEADVPLSALDDSGVVDDIVLTTDSHTVKPIFFPGGDIGSLSICGTVNDLSVMGAKPVALSAAFVLEEGFPIPDLERILKSMDSSCKKAGVQILTGDTKVMERGALEKIIINTSGVGVRTKELEKNIEEIRKYREFSSRWLLDSNLREGDKLILTGPIGEHGVALLSFREGYGFESEVVSDIRPLNRMLFSALKAGGVVAMKDPTRGGLANLLNEFSDKSGIGIFVKEEDILVRKPVSSACKMLGLDPLEIGNEGVAVIGVVKEKAEDVLEEVKRMEEGKDARIIGEATTKIHGVVMETLVGGRRIVEQPLGDPIPRIC
jgi:hydrogenase expression/formation protein HypE